MSRQLRLGLTQRVAVDADSGERRDCLDQRWAELLGAYGYLVVPLPNLVADPAAVVKDLGLHGMVLTGGNDLASVPNGADPAPERDALESELLRYAAAIRLPVLGVCRGMQMMAHHFGTPVVAVQDHVLPEHPIAMQTGTPMPLAPVERVNSYHHFGLLSERLGGEFVACALAGDGTVEALMHRHLPQWGIMWHPERGAPSPRDREIFARLFGVAGK